MSDNNLKNEILACAKRLFKVKGYDKTTFQMIADELKITKGAITYHYKYKWAIFDELFSAYLKHLHAYIGDNLKQNYNSYLHYIIVYISFFRQVMKNEGNWNFFYKNEIKNYLYRKKFHLFDNMCRSITTDFHKDFSEEELRMAIHMGLGAVMNLMDEYEKGAEPLNADQYCYYCSYAIGVFCRLDEATIKKNTSLAFEFLNNYIPPSFSLFN